MLLTCAAVGVATGILGAIAGWITVLVLAVAPILYGFVLGVHVLPGIVAQQVLRAPWVALIAHLLAALVSSAFAPMYALQFVLTALLFGGIQEAVAALTRYRAWSTWRFLISAVAIGVVIAAVVALAADLQRLAPWAQVAYVGLSLAGPVGWTLVGRATGSALRRAGISQAS